MFAIKEVKSGKLLSSPMFGDKQLAKEHRRKLNGQTKEGTEIFEYVVTYGPDHDRFELSIAQFLVVKAVDSEKNQSEKQEKQPA